MKINVPLRRKDAEIEISPCVVEKNVELSADRFDHFSQNLLNDYDFILENTDCMYQDKEGVSHCILVLGEGFDDGILVESEGSAYARYSAFVPNARQLLKQEQRYEPALQDYCNRMQAAMDKIVQTVPSRQQDGMLRILLSDLSPSPGEYPLDTAMLFEMLSGEPEFDTAELFEDEIIIQMNPKYLPSEKKEYHSLSQEQADIMCAKHILWLNDAGGEQADFSNCLVRELNLAHKNMMNAVMDNARFIDTDLRGAELNFSVIGGTRFENCNLKNVTAEECEITDTVFSGCEMTGGIYTHSDLSRTVMIDCKMSYGSFQNCCTDGTNFCGLDYSGEINMQGCNSDREEWQKESLEQELTM